MNRTLHDIMRTPQENASIDLGTYNLPSVPASLGVKVRARHTPGVIHRTVLTLAALSVTLTDAGIAGAQGNAQLLDLPAGTIVFLGATCDLTTLAGTGGIVDNAALVGSVGTAAAAAADATLSGTEADIIPSTAGTLAAGAGTLKGSSATANVALFDGRTVAKDVFLNIAAPDAGSSANDTVLISGTITILWAFAGDN